MNIKNAYLSNGSYREASWAYLKERRMRRGALAPWRVKIYYKERVGDKPGFLNWRWVWYFFLTSWLWLIDLLVDLSSGYGEKPLRSGFLAVLVVFIFPVFYWLTGEIVQTNGLQLKWIDYLIFSLGAFTTMDFARFSTTGWVVELIASLQAMLGISILALLMFALGNRISKS